MNKHTTNTTGTSAALPIHDRIARGIGRGGSREHRKADALVSRLAYAKQRLEEHVSEQRRQLAWAAKHLDDHDTGDLGDTDVDELRVALLKALAGTLDAEEVANLLPDDAATEQAVRQ